MLDKAWKGFTDIWGVSWTADERCLYKTLSDHHPAKIVIGTENGRPRAFMRDRQEHIWIGMSKPQGIRVYNRDWSVWRTISLPFAPYVIYKTRNGEIWTGGKPGGLMKVGGQTISHDAVYDIKEDAWGRLWIATWEHEVHSKPRISKTCNISLIGWLQSQEDSHHSQRQYYRGLYKWTYGGTY